MGEGINSEGVNLCKNGAPIGGVRGTSRRGDVVKSVSSTSRRYNVTKEGERGYVSRGVWGYSLWNRRIPKAG
ncbi:hypothetical protein BJY01DRAFT_159331 [Aspergillus pseudoustus]|uniref:Uncharacterized protein n=1 Tax=Aspergillus pseudoustus TaxID=1810923 RepID=A0ABR4KY04_9EURO